MGLHVVEEGEVPQQPPQSYALTDLFTRWQLDMSELEYAREEFELRVERNVLSDPLAPQELRSRAAARLNASVEYHSLMDARIALRESELRLLLAARGVL